MFLEFTTVVGCDARYCKQFAMVWPTWRRYKPEILASPLLVVCDAAAGGQSWWRRRLDWLDHPDWRVVLWDWPGRQAGRSDAVSQRERMLSAFVYAPCEHVQTRYWLKLDTDAVATAPGAWFDREWFAGSPALVSSPWPYTKPGVWIDRLEEWGDGHPQLGAFASLGLRSPPGAATFRHARIASWLCFVRSDFGRLAASYAPKRLPVPSQDTYHWYVAARRGERITRRRMKDYGWAPIHNDGRRRRLIDEVMRQED